MDPGVVPNNGNSGVDYDVTFSTGTLTQDIVAGVTINQLFMSGGTLVLANPLTLNYGLQFTGGSITSGILNIAGDSTQSALMTVSGTTLNNSGTIKSPSPAETSSAAPAPSLITPATSPPALGPDRSASIFRSPTPAPFPPKAAPRSR